MGRSAAAAAAPSRPWLFGPGPDLVLGCGLGYAAVFAVMALFGASVREALPLGIAFLPVNLVSSAHYGATALRAYERPEDRRAWMLFTLWSTLALGAAFVWGLASHDAGSWFITAYLTWSPWHYALQNYGVALMFLRRRAVTVTPGARRALYASFVLSFVLAAVALHASDVGTSYAPNQLESGVYAFRPLATLVGVPHAAADVALAALGVAWLGATVAAVVLLRRAAAFRALGPTLALVGTQALWFSVPVLVRQAGWLQGVDPFSVEHAAYAFLWIGAGHAVQYLWITAYFARQSGRSTSHASFVTKALLAGTALWTVPALVFAPGLLGRLPYDAGLAAMVAALVNLHHFVLDGVIWKLRDQRVARVLVVGETDASPGLATKRAAAVRFALWATGGLLLAASVAWALLVVEFNGAFERGDLDGARRAAERLRRLGQANGEMHLRLGQAYLARGELSAAEICLERSLDIRPTAWGWTGMGDVHARRQEWAAAEEAYARALALDASHAVATFHAAVVALDRGQPDRARRGLLRARTLAEHDPDAAPGLVESIDRVLGDARLEGLQ